MPGSFQINRGAFPVKVRGETAYREGRGQAWQISKDTANHGGRAWKLKNEKGVVVANLNAEFYVLGSRGPIMSLESVGGRENND